MALRTFGFRFASYPSLCRDSRVPIHPLTSTSCDKTTRSIPVPTSGRSSYCHPTTATLNPLARSADSTSSPNLPAPPEHTPPEAAEAMQMPPLLFSLFGLPLEG
ncbi:hypothetical protein RhiXN_09480 [Rhizoctonia solani]|uniref:Uncharacterized protein n=1 Tax=Rhizoctonia solani TaxID=456999 RepID=A0A8H8P119_9AGAM|nr:uncharacterized protein RhiXN_09480 [Rhizoctonia solani]QRW21893.1 hypothetical protein RhiXN_09480 [Rhizoctonia solani]